MGHHQKKFDMGHLKSQKFAGMVFCVAVLFAAGFFLPLAAFGNLVMGVTGLYAAFVGGRAYSDGQALKFGGTVSTGESSHSVVKPLPTKPAPHEVHHDDDAGDEEID